MERNPILSEEWMEQTTLHVFAEVTQTLIAAAAACGLELEATQVQRRANGPAHVEMIFRTPSGRMGLNVTEAIAEVLLVDEDKPELGLDPNLLDAQALRTKIGAVVGARCVLLDVAAHRAETGSEVLP